MIGSGRRRKFKSPNKNYSEFKSAERPFSPSPKLKNYEKTALTKSDHHTICTYIHPDTKKRCGIKLGIYPRYCHIHSLLIENLGISKSKIPNAGNGLFVGAFPFNKGDIIGEYSRPWTRVSEKAIYSRNGKYKNGEDKPVNTSYIFCDDHERYCWDSLDARSTIMRNANDAHNSQFKNNAYFTIIKDKKGEEHVYMVAAKKISAYKEIYCDYGDSYIFH